jgi:membrane protease YdiL (CAAX protease family)
VDVQEALEVGDRHVPLAAALALTLAAGLVGWLTDRLAVHFGQTFPSMGYFLGEVVWKLATLAVLVWGVKKFDGRRLNLSSCGFTSVPSHVRTSYPIALSGIVLIGSSVLLITVGSSAANGSTYGVIHHAPLGVLLAEILIRYPLTAIVEESFFRGWLQPRLGRRGPVLSALLWSFYHLQQVSTIPFLIIFGLGLGALRWWLGNIRVSTCVHYFSDVGFFFATYA